MLAQLLLKEGDHGDPSVVCMTGQLGYTCWDNNVNYLLGVVCQ